jgi:hypothetical protein
MERQLALARGQLAPPERPPDEDVCRFRLAPSWLLVSALVTKQAGLKHALVALYLILPALNLVCFRF